MRFTSILKKLLGVTQLYVRGIAIDRDDEIAVEVTPAWRKPRCARCGTRAAQYDHPPRRVGGGIGDGEDGGNEREGRQEEERERAEKAEGGRGGAQRGTPQTEQSIRSNLRIFL